jgi:hypothetical protein
MIGDLWRWPHSQASDCTHESVNEQEGDTWTDCNGNLHTVIKSKCNNPFCPRFGQVVRVRQTGSDTPVRYSMPPVIFKGAGKP